jgi:hypothetical protein
VVKAYHELERAQAARRGVLVAPPAALDVTISAQEIAESPVDSERQTVDVSVQEIAESPVDSERQTVDVSVQAIAESPVDSERQTVDVCAQETAESPVDGEMRTVDPPQKAGDETPDAFQVQTLPEAPRPDAGGTVDAIPLLTEQTTTIGGRVQNEPTGTE